MDSQSFDYWLSQGQFVQQPPHAIFELPSDPSTVSSISDSPVSLQCFCNHGLIEPQNIYSSLTCTSRQSHRNALNAILTSSQVSSNFDTISAPIYQAHYGHVPEEINYAYQFPMTPSDLGSADESPYCSPRPQAMEIVYPAPAPAVPERTHTTSGVST